MLITRIVLQDYGVYRGRNEFDLECTPEKPVILVGGTNGAGKTTLFESVTLCLYGMSALGKKPSKKEYERFLAKKIHRYGGQTARADFASVTVQFRFYHAGVDTEYRVNRTWSKKEDIEGVDERLFVHKRTVGTGHSKEFVPLDVVEESHWQSFIQDLIPRGVAGLFFFDGEKIVRMARQEGDDFEIRGSFKSLLGLDIAEQLRSDLQVNLMRNLTRGGMGALQEEYDRYRDEKDENLSGITKLEERIAQKQGDLDRIRARIAEVEAGISRVGGEFTSRREDARASLAAKKEAYAGIHRRMLDACAGVLPFSLVPDLMEDVRSRIEADQLVLQDRMGDKAVRSRLRQIRSDVRGDAFLDGLGLDGKTAGAVQKRMLAALGSGGSGRGRKMDAGEEDDVRGDAKEVFGFSTIQSTRILGMIDNANGPALEALSHDTRDLVDVGGKIEALEQTLASAAGDDEIGPMVSELGKLNAEAGQLQAEIDHMDEKVASNRALCTHIDSKMRGLVDKMYQDEKAETKVMLTQKVQEVLDEFVEQVKVKKLRLLEQYLLEGTRLLMHKNDLVTKITVDPDTFAVHLFGRDGQEMPKDLLSEGEKQMFATSVLWALAKTSGRPLPFLIDTPLARLDEAHRTNMVERFLPSAAHQVIIFSTDKEIELKYYRSLAPHLARSYVMEFFQEDGSTTCHDGYFWNKRGDKVVAV